MTMLELVGTSAGYGRAVVIHELDLRVGDGEAVALLGANGAGKTTVLRAISGLTWSRGTTRVRGTDTRGLGAAAIARLGVGHVPEGRGTFATLSVGDNLRLGAWGRKDRQAADRERDEWLQRFPQLAERLRHPAGLLSGGEQQMLAIARAALAAPRLLLLDEPSCGLAPTVVRTVVAALADLRQRTGVAMLLVEQNAAAIAALIDRAALLASGQLVAEGQAAEILDAGRLHAAYLGG